MPIEIEIVDEPIPEQSRALWREIRVETIPVGKCMVIRGIRGKDGKSARDVAEQYRGSVIAASRALKRRFYTKVLEEKAPPGSGQQSTQTLKIWRKPDKVGGGFKIKGAPEAGDKEDGDGDE